MNKNPVCSFHLVIAPSNSPCNISLSTRLESPGINIHCCLIPHQPGSLGYPKLSHKAHLRRQLGDFNRPLFAPSSRSRLPTACLFQSLETRRHCGVDSRDRRPIPTSHQALVKHFPLLNLSNIHGDLVKASTRRDDIPQPSGQIELLETR